MPKSKISDFEHFFSASSRRVGRLSRDFRAVLGVIKKRCVGILYIPSGSGATESPTWPKIAKSLFWELPFIIYKGKLPEVGFRDFS